MKKIWILLAASALVLASCDPQVDNNSFSGQAYVPVYAQPGQTLNITLQSPKATENAGKVYVYNNYIFQNDQQKGIHVIDNSNPASPQKIGFIPVPFSTEIAIKSNYLYTNSLNDMVVINISDPLHPVLSKKLDGAFPLINQNYPPFTGVYFVCPDPSKGVVVSWELQTVDQPKCRR